MSRKQAVEEQQELLHDHDHSHDDEEGNVDSIELSSGEHGEQVTTRPSTFHSQSLLPRTWLPWSWSRHSKLIAGFSHPAYSSCIRRRRCTLARSTQLLSLLLSLVAGLVVICGVFFPSYSNPPARYNILRQQIALDPTRSGRANLHNETIFIAASLSDPAGRLVAGDWGRAVSRLIDILGPENVHLSIYENDADPEARAALQIFGEGLKCNSSVVEEKLDHSQLTHVSTSDGQSRLKRIAFLAEVRNRALRPLEDEGSTASQTRFDKLLYVNDVVFDPVDAANLLFSTNVDETTGKTQYHAACALDFIDPIKFYDTFATRDLEGFNIGVPFFPWFTTAGAGASRRDVLAQKDGVRVKSCWGGMVAFEAQWFQSSTSSTSKMPQESVPPLRFRAENDTFWDASECCLVHADLAMLAPTDDGESAILMNPYVRVAYSAMTLRWLGFTRRFERLFPPVHLLANWIAARPGHNPRRLEQPGQVVTDRVWGWDAASQAATSDERKVDKEALQGTFHDVQRVAAPGGFCGSRVLLYINEAPLDGESKWGSAIAPEEE
nr:hypothetical protein CFP56_24636 [Quercus suber]